MDLAGFVRRLVLPAGFAALAVLEYANYLPGHTVGDRRPWPAWTHAVGSRWLMSRSEVVDPLRERLGWAPDSIRNREARRSGRA